MKATEVQWEEHRQKHIGHYNDTFQDKKGGTKIIKTRVKSRSALNH